MEVKELCRLCANKNSVCKDLLHADNKGLLKLTQEFIQIVVYENDNLPSSICINCEEKMVSFQLFVLECLDAQEVLRRTFLDNVQCTDIKKEEHSILDYIPPVIKSEVKDEIIREELCADEIGGNVPTVYEDNSDADPDFIVDDDYLSDDLSIAALKHRKDTEVKNRVPTEEDLKTLQELSIKRDLKVHNFFKLECTTCNETFVSWTALYFHFYKIHKQKAVAFCLCGVAIKSKNALYKHFNEHKSEFRKMNKNMQKENEESRSSGVKVSDYVKFTCPECSKDFSSWYTLKTHCERKHRIMPFVKCKCGVTLKSKSVMYKHVGDHKSPDILACDKCPRITKSLSALNKHKMRHVPKAERKFCCAMCDKIFNSKEGLKSHEKSHIPVEDRKVFRCDKCDMKFTTRSSAASHRRVVHDKIKSYVCDLCGYSCGTNGELRQHRAIHSDDKPFVCKICPKTFKTYSNLKTHEDTHENTSYQCHKCRRVLNSRRTLRKHLLVHQDECRHVCSYCLKAFKRRQTLKVHMHTHTGDKPLACQWCSERFAYASTLRSHRLRCHPDKMAARSTDNYSVFQHAPIQQNYVKSNLSTAVPPVSKNEVEAL